jgi:hypothetical protein
MTACPYGFNVKLFILLVKRGSSFVAGRSGCRSLAYKGKLGMWEFDRALWQFSATVDASDRIARPIR